MRTIEIDTVYGMLPAYQDDDGSWRIPVNSTIDWAKAVLTPEDWKLLEDCGDGKKISVGIVDVDVEEHPDGIECGGRVLTATFHNVKQYMKDDHSEVWPSDSSVYYDECDGEWAS